MNRNYRKQIQQNKFSIVGLAYLLIWSLLVLLVFKVNYVNKSKKASQCYPETKLTLTNNIPQVIKGNARKNKPICFYFDASYGQKLMLNTKSEISLSTPSRKLIILQGSSLNILPDTGKYSILINTDLNALYQIELSIEKQSIANNPALENIEPQSRSPQGNNNVPLQPSYNVDIAPPFDPNHELQTIVASIFKFVESRGLPTERLSVSLVDLSNSECCAYASYLDRERRFPASIVKLFWMVNLYDQYQTREIQERTNIKKELSKMIQDSSNESASRILDKVTKTSSGKELSPNELNKWIEQRSSVNYFFKQAGYDNFNVSQKTFPIPYLNLNEPQGRELQMRGNVSQPTRNYLTTYSVARLLFEIHKERAVSKPYSQKMKALLKRDLRPEAWKKKPYNSIAGFLGESLPLDTDFTSKMGWTFSNRNDAAIIASPDRKTHYILVIFGDDPSFYEDKKLFPEISRMVYEQITILNSS